MKIFIINLDKSSDRMAYQEEKMAELGLAFERFRALNPDEINVSSYHKRVRNCENHPLSIEQLGCFDSHYRLWKIIAEMNEPVLVLEDDARLSADMPELLDIIEKQFFDKLQNAHIQLNNIYQDEYYICVDKRYIFPLIKNYHLMRFYRYRETHKHLIWGSQGQIIYPKTAQRFLKKARKKVCLVDKFYNLFPKESWIINPMPVSASDKFISVIAGEGKLNIYKKTMFDNQTYLDRLRYARNSKIFLVNNKIMSRIKRRLMDKKIIKRWLKYPENYC